MPPKTKTAVDSEPAAAQAPSWSFRVRDNGEEDGVTRVSLGGAPRISLGLGVTFTTEDEKLAARLRNDPHLEEVTSR